MTGIGTSPCSACPFSNGGFCGAVLHAADGSAADGTESWQYHRVFATGKPELHQNQTYPDVFVLCGGWGIRFIQLPDGGRQILNFLLPGDLFSVSLVFEGRVHFSVKALTTIHRDRCCRGNSSGRPTSRRRTSPGSAEPSCRSDISAPPCWSTSPAVRRWPVPLPVRPAGASARAPWVGCSRRRG